LTPDLPGGSVEKIGVSPKLTSELSENAVNIFTLTWMAEIPHFSPN
jgi:hypothetical protein